MSQSNFKPKTKFDEKNKTTSSLSSALLVGPQTSSNKIAKTLSDVNKTKKTDDNIVKTERTESKSNLHTRNKYQNTKIKIVEEGDNLPQILGKDREEKGK